jgi:dodecin
VSSGGRKEHRVYKRREKLRRMNGGTEMAGTGGTIYKKTELVGTSTVGYDDAVKAAIGRAQKTLRHVDWFEVKELRGRIDNGEIVYQATLEIGFALEDVNP